MSFDNHILCSSIDSGLTFKILVSDIFKKFEIKQESQKSGERNNLQEILIGDQGPFGIGSLPPGIDVQGVILGGKVNTNWKRTVQAEMESCGL